MRSLIEKALGWNIHIWICDGDIRKAYEYSLYSRVLKGLLEHDCPRILAAARVREFRRMEVALKLGEFTSQTVERTRPLLQGNPSAPKTFNYTLDMPLYQFHILCQREEWGIPVKDGEGKNLYLGIICLADNYQLFANSPSILRIMIQTWLNLLGSFGRHTPVRELTYCTTAANTELINPLIINIEVVKRNLRETWIQGPEHSSYFRQQERC